MDPTNLSMEDGHQNGVHEQLSNSANGGFDSNVDTIITEIVETVALNGNFEFFDHNSSTGETKEGSNVKLEGNNVKVSKEEEIVDETEKTRTQKGSVKNKNAKQASPRGVHTSSVRKSKDGKEEEAAAAASSVSNGTSTLDSQLRHPVKNKAFNDKLLRLSKLPGMSEPASSVAPMEKTRPQLVKKELVDNLPRKAESSSPTAEDAKPHKVGTMPNYGFSFKCNERAERRKEFYSKLEERIHAKEVEESNIQAKTKESQEAEIRRLRKKLAFKATPMPSFYQEPLPSRTELKKIPTTRAKSPKLGRRKNSISSESEVKTNISAQQCRLSLDEKVSLNNPTKGISHVHQKKPQRRSLPPRLTPVKNSSSNSATARTSSKAVNDEKTSLSSVTTEVTALSNATKEEKNEASTAIEENNALSETSETLSLNIETGEADSHVNGEIVIENKPQLIMVQKPIAAEH